MVLYQGKKLARIVKKADLCFRCFPFVFVPVISLLAMFSIYIVEEKDTRTVFDISMILMGMGLGLMVLGMAVSHIIKRMTLKKCLNRMQKAIEKSDRDFFVVRLSDGRCGLYFKQELIERFESLRFWGWYDHISINISHGSGAVDITDADVELFDSVQSQHKSCVEERCSRVRKCIASLKESFDESAAKFTNEEVRLASLLTS